MKLDLHKLGSPGAIVAAAACPVCFPKLALIGAVLGLGALAQYEVYFFIATGVLVLAALGGVLWTHRAVPDRRISVVAIGSAVLFFASLYVVVTEYLSYLAFGGLLAAIIWQSIESSRCPLRDENAGTGS
jgi:mercuric ion transport protein